MTNVTRKIKQFITKNHNIEPNNYLREMEEAYKEAING